MRTSTLPLPRSAMVAEGCSEADARRRNWLVDSHGLVVKSRSDLAEHKLAYAHEHAPIAEIGDGRRGLLGSRRPAAQLARRFARPGREEPLRSCRAQARLCARARSHCRDRRWSPRAARKPTPGGATGSSIRTAWS